MKYYMKCHRKYKIRQKVTVMFDVRTEAPLGLGHAVPGWGRLMMLCFLIRN